MSVSPLRLFLAISLIGATGATGVTAQTVEAEPPVTPVQPAVPAQAAATSEDLVGPIKLSDDSVDQVLAMLEMFTGRTIIRPQALPTATYTLKLNKAIPKSEAILALETLLALNQIGFSPMGDKFIKVVALAQVKTEAPEMITGSALDLPTSGRTATKLFQPEFLRISEIVPQFQSLLSPGIGGGIVILDKANAALITDSISNLQRVETLLAKLDRPVITGLSPKFYTLQFAKASDLVNKLRTFLQGPLANQLGTTTTYNADDRTNQIVLIADPRLYPFFDELVAKLDIKADPNTRNEVIYLKHATAKDVASLLSQLVSGQNNAARTSGQQSARPLQNPQQPAQPNILTQVAAVGGNPSEQGNDFSGLITILPDERSNAVVVTGTVDDIRLIRELVDKIDIILAQVRIEVIIAEVTLNDSDRSGISALNLKIATDTPDGPGGDNGRGTHITQFPLANVAGWNISGGVVNPLTFDAALGDTGSKSNVKILSAPTIVTTHNKEAQIIVGQSQPIITGSQSTPVSTGIGTGTGFSTSSQVTYKDIAIDLKVTPLIGDDGTIQLKIDQKVDDILGNVTIDNNQQPIIGRRQATSFINVTDGQMVVLGGLQRTKNNTSRTKLGFFYEIPILSHLLGGRNNAVERTELLLFIRPHVLRPDEGSRDAARTIETLSNREQVKEFLQNPGAQPKKDLLDRVR